MIRREFFDGGFPINKRNPVLCSTNDGDIVVAYNQYDLRKIILENRHITKCMGVWPGKYNSDCFVLDPEKYSNIPPEEHSIIDSATNIIVYHNKEPMKFKKLVYYTTDSNGTKIEHSSENVDLFTYITRLGLHFKTVYE